MTDIVRLMDNEPPNLRNLAKEIFSDRCFERARQRAKRRKSPWNLVLIPLGVCSIAIIACALFRTMWRVHVLFHPDHAGRLKEFWAAGISLNAFVSSFLLLIPLLLAAIPLGMILANALAWCIPSARRAFEREAGGVKWASFSETMSALTKITLILVPICLLLSLVGAVTLKNMR